MKRLASIFILIALASCSSVEEELKQTEALQTKLSQADEVFQKWDFEQMKSRKKQIDERIDSVSSYYKNNGLVMDMKVGLIMADFKNSGKAFKRITADYNKVKEELSFSKSQLENMATDLKAGTMEKEAMKGYLIEEKEAVDAIYAQVVKLDTIFMRSDKVYSKYAPKVDSLMATFSSPEN